MKSINFIDRQTAIKLGMKFYISNNECSKCKSNPSLRYTANSVCISCRRKAWRDEKK